MTNTQFYFIQQCQTKYYIYNTNENVKDLLPKNYFFIPFILNKKKSGIYRQQ